MNVHTDIAISVPVAPKNLMKKLYLLESVPLDDVLKNPDPIFSYALVLPCQVVNPKKTPESILQPN